MNQHNRHRLTVLAMFTSVLLLASLIVVGLERCVSDAAAQSTLAPPAPDNPPVTIACDRPVPQCLPHDEMASVLLRCHGEDIVWTGPTTSGRHIGIIYAHPIDRTWTFNMLDINTGQECRRTHGIGAQSHDPRKGEEGT